MDWLNGLLRVERGIVERIVDDTKTDESRKSLAIADDLLDSYTGVWRELDRASEAAGLGHMGTHTFRHSYPMWIDAIGTPIGCNRNSCGIPTSAPP